MPQLLRIHHGPHALDPPLGGVERDDADDSVPLIDDLRPRLPVDLDAHEPDARRFELAEDPRQQAPHAVRPDDRTRDRGDLAAAVAVERGVRGQQLDEAVEVAPLASGEEPLGDLIALRGRRLEAPLARVDVAFRPGEDLPAVVLALLHDRCDLVVGVVEHLAQEEHGALDR